MRRFPGREAKVTLDLDLPYTRAVIQEALRAEMVTPINVPRRRELDGIRETEEHWGEHWTMDAQMKTIYLRTHRPQSHDHAAYIASFVLDNENK